MIVVDMKSWSIAMMIGQIRMGTLDGDGYVNIWIRTHYTTPPHSIRG